MANIENKVFSLINEKVNQIGYEIYDIIYEKVAKDYYLRIFIDNQNGIDLEDCEKVSRYVSDILDEEDFIKEAYFLEVSSPGVERFLRKDTQLEKEIGNLVEISLFKTMFNYKVHTGELLGFNKNEIEINVNGDKRKFERKDISQIKTKFIWDDGGK